MAGIFVGNHVSLQEKENRKTDKAEDKTADEQESEENTWQDLQKQEGLEVHFVDVGQGDATLIICGEHAMLIDAGDNNKGTAVQYYLQKQGVTKLDYLIGTHPDADHIGGLDVIITKFDCNRIIMPEVQRDMATYRDVIDAMEYKQYRNTRPMVGTQYFLGDAVFTVVAPVGNYGEEYNNYSVGILLTYGENKFLFTGDAERMAEYDMLQTGIDLSADVLKVGHHGSSDSTSKSFLEAVSPKYAVISCGADNDYGHPHRRTMDILEESGIAVYRTDELGDIVFYSDGQNIMVN
ncbi:MAG: MBL fold metallo-hydrolase [Lachnospiraceae bacterium]|nr:MBL fold metallo-hydrolase [Lachnospiraceae bacterium]